MLRRMSQTKVNRRSFLGGRRPDRRGPPRSPPAPAGARPAPLRAPPRPLPLRRRGASAAPVASASAAAAGPLEKELLMYNWSLGTSTRTTSTPSRPSSGSTTFQYDVYGNNEELLAKLKERRGQATTSPRRPPEYLPGDGGGGLHPEARRQPNRNLKYINEKFKALWWDKTDEYHVPKDFGTTGILYRGKTVPEPASSRGPDFYHLHQGRGIGQERSSSTRWAT